MKIIFQYFTTDFRKSHSDLSEQTPQVDDIKIASSSFSKVNICPNVRRVLFPSAKAN